MRWRILIVLLFNFFVVFPQSVFINRGLIAYYPFNGNAKDMSGNGHDAVVHEAVLTTDRFGNPESAYFFNGFTGEIYVPSSHSINLNSEEITISFWLRCESIWGRGDYVGFSLGENGLIIGGSYRQRIVRFYIDTNGLSIKDSLACRDEWVHYAGVFSHGNAKIYENGKLVGEKKLNVTGIAISDEPLYIGNLDSKYNFAGKLVGKTDDLRIYDRALTSYEIMTLYNGIPKSVSLPGLESANINLLILKDNGKPYKKADIWINNDLAGFTDDFGRLKIREKDISNLQISISKGKKYYNKTLELSPDSIYYITIKFSANQLLTTVTSKSYDELVYNEIKDSNDISTWFMFLYRFPNTKYERDIIKKLEELYYQRALKSRTISDYEAYLGNFNDGKYAEQMKKGLDSALFAKAKQTNTLASYIEYLKNAPLGLYKKEAEDAAYLVVKNKNTKAAYSEFLNAFPSSSYVTEARNAIANINKQQVKQLEYQYYRKAITGDLIDCDKYLDFYPNGRYVSQVKAQRERLYYSKAMSGSIDDCDNYLSQYPYGKYKSQVKARKDDLLYEQVKDGDLEECQKYLSAFPNGKHASEMRERVAYLKAKSSNSISGLNAYLNSYPNGKYYNELKEIKNKLVAKQRREAQIRANSDIRKWQLGYKICRQDYRGIIMGTIEQWNANKTRVQIKIAASPGGMTDEGDMLTKGNTIWVDPKDGWHLCLQDEKEYALSHDKSADFERYVSTNKNTREPKFDLGRRVCYTVSKTIIPFVYSDDVTICGTVEQWNSSYTKMKVKITSRVYYDDITINGQPVYQGAEIWVSPYGWQ